ncbi:hypothetical protein C8J57DRAFT_1491438 [Mycena rebaudengoi]|nr:hypothetical protein C8J57DRAFT_1491438 [Mycena rebaudengoi]
MSVPPRCICDDCTALFQHPLVHAATPALKEELAWAITGQNSHTRALDVGGALRAIGIPRPDIMRIGSWLEDHDFRYPSPGSSNDDVATQLAEMRVTTAPPPHTAILFALFSPVLSTRTPLPLLNLVT